jgi:hypothetical protein
MSARECRISDQSDRFLYGLDRVLRNDMFDKTWLLGRQTCRGRTTFCAVAISKVAARDVLRRFLRVLSGCVPMSPKTVRGSSALAILGSR